MAWREVSEEHGRGAGKGERRGANKQGQAARKQRAKQEPSEGPAPPRRKPRKKFRRETPGSTSTVTAETGHDRRGGRVGGNEEVDKIGANGRGFASVSEGGKALGQGVRTGRREPLVSKQKPEAQKGHEG